MIELHVSHLLIRFHLSGRQIACDHADDLLVVHLGGHGIVPNLSDFMLAVLIELRS
jgi:hypothetical protein